MLILLTLPILLRKEEDPLDKPEKKRPTGPTAKGRPETAQSATIPSLEKYSNFLETAGRRGKFGDPGQADPGPATAPKTRCRCSHFFAIRLGLRDADRRRAYAIWRKARPASPLPRTRSC